MKTPPDQTNRGFTLPETLTTLAIIVILTALLVPSMLNWRARAYESRLHATSNLLAQACVRAGLAGETVPSDSRGTLADVVDWYQTNNYVQKGKVDISGLTLDAIGAGSYFDCTNASTETRSIIGAPVLPGPIAAVWWNTRYIQLSVPNAPIDAQYLVLESSPDNQTWTELKSGVLDSYTDGPFQPNTSFYYRVAAVNSYGRTAGPSSKATTAPPLSAPNSLSIALGSTTTTSTPNSPPPMPVTYSLPSVPATPGSGSSSISGNDIGGWEWLFAKSGTNSSYSSGGTATATPLTPPGAITFTSVTSYSYTLTLPTLPHDLVDENGRIFDFAWNWTLFSGTNGKDWTSSPQFDWRSALGPLDAKTGFGWICQESGAWLENPAPVSFAATPGTTYYYQLVGQDTAGLLVYGDVISITTPVDGGTPTTPPVSPNAPVAPAQVSISDLAQTSLTITMPPLPERATSQTLEASTDGGNSWVVVASGLGANAVVPQSKLTSTMTYAYCVSAVNTYGATQGSPLAVTTLGGLPSVPGSVTVGNKTTNGYTFTFPQLPANATSFTLQTSENGATWTNIGTGYGSGAVVPRTGLAANTSTPYLLLAVNQYGYAPGTPFFATTGGVPSKPAPPTSTILTTTSFNLQLPVLPSFATGLTLQSSPDEGSTWLPQSGNPVLAGHAVVSVTATPGTTYTYRVVAVNQWGEAPSDAMTVTAPQVPSTPDVATVLDLSVTGFRLLMPQLPTGATSLKLEAYSASWDSDPANQGLDGGVLLTLTDKAPSTEYNYRVVAVNQWGETAGAQFSVTMPPSGLGVPGVPAAATVSNLVPWSFTVTMPSLPANADFLTLQALSSGASWDVAYGWTDLATLDEGAWMTVSSGLPADQSVDVGGMVEGGAFIPGHPYIYRLVAVSMAGYTAGTPFTVTIPTSLPAPDAPASTTVSNSSPAGLDLTMPVLPAYADTLTLQMSFDGGNAWYNWGADYRSAGEVVFVDTPPQGTTLTFRVVANGQGGSTAGTPFDPFTASTPAPDADAPAPATVSNVLPGGVELTMPALPANAATLTLQMSFDGGNAWYNFMADFRSAGEVVFVDTPPQGMTLTFRVVANGQSGSIASSSFNPFQ